MLCPMLGIFYMWVWDGTIMILILELLLLSLFTDEETEAERKVYVQSHRRTVSKSLQFWLLGYVTSDLWHNITW